MDSKPRGGRRDGAGRKPLEGGRITAAFVLREDQVEWLETQATNSDRSKSDVMRAIIDREMKRQARQPPKQGIYRFAATRDDVRAVVRIDDLLQ